MVAFPIVTALISLLCAGTLALDAWRRPRADKVIWAIAFVLFAIAAGTDAFGRATGWNTNLARAYYATGPALVVAYLAIGQLYLLWPERLKRFGPGATILTTVFWASMVFNAGIDKAKLAADDGWEAIHRGPAMVAITIAINSIGTLIIVGGTLWSVWRFLKRGGARDKAIGCTLIAVGTIVVAMGGTLTRLGHYEYLYIAMSVGVALIYLGVITAKSPQPRAAKQPVTPKTKPATTPALSSSPIPASGSALGFVQQLLALNNDPELDRICAEWSVPRDASPNLTRTEARRAWRLRSQLDDEVQCHFDAHSVPARRQLANLYFDVMLPERSATDEIAEIVPTEGANRLRQA